MLWLLPLLGAMAGNWVHSSKFANTSSGVVLVRPRTLVFAPGTCIPSYDETVDPVLSSPALFRPVASKPDLGSRWQMKFLVIPGIPAFP